MCRPRAVDHATRGSCVRDARTLLPCFDWTTSNQLCLAATSRFAVCHAPLSSLRVDKKELKCLGDPRVTGRMRMTAVILDRAKQAISTRTEV